MNKSSKLIISLLALAALAGVIFFFQNSANKPTPNSSKVEIPEGWKVYRDEIARYSIMYPGYFNMKQEDFSKNPYLITDKTDSKKTIYKVPFNPNKEDSYRTIISRTYFQNTGELTADNVGNTLISVTVYENPENLTGEQWAKESGGYPYFYLNPEVSVIKKKNIKINGLDTVVFEMLENSDVYISKNGKLFSLSQTAFSETDKKIFKKFLNSLTID